jgi:anti-sigma factor (TIGR02949 family)
MTDCGCEKAKAELEEYLHNELCKEDAADIREHMAHCVDCSGEAKVGVVLTVAVQRACKETAPEDLRAQVLGMLRDAQSTHSSAPARV